MENIDIKIIQVELLQRIATRLREESLKSDEGLTTILTYKVIDEVLTEILAE